MAKRGVRKVRPKYRESRRNNQSSFGRGFGDGIRLSMKFSFLYWLLSHKQEDTRAGWRG